MKDLKDYRGEIKIEVHITQYLTELMKQSVFYLEGLENLLRNSVGLLMILQLFLEDGYLAVPGGNGGVQCRHFVLAGCLLRLASILRF